MRKATASEMRDGFIQAEADAVIVQSQDAKQPSESAQHSAKLIVEAFGRRVSDSPATRDLHQAFAHTRECGANVQRAVSSVQTNEHIQNKSYNRFQMQRDWAA